MRISCFLSLQRDDIKIKNDSSKIGRIRVTGGEMTATHIIKELEWLVPGKHQWDVSPAGNNTFRVMFPTKADFVRLKKIKFIEVEETCFRMYFEDWSTQKIDTCGLYDIWVHVSG